MAKPNMSMRNALGNDLSNLSKAARTFIDKEKKLFIDGEWRNGDDHVRGLRLTPVWRRLSQRQRLSQPAILTA